MADEQYELNDDSENGAKGKSSNTWLIVGLVIAGIAVIALLFFLVAGRGSGGTTPDPGPGGGEGSAGMVIPTPLPGSPSFTVAAPDGANVRTGPSTDFAIIGALTTGTTGQVTGITADDSWLQILAPQGPNGQGWLSAGLVSVENMVNVPVVPPEGVEPTATPEVLLLFTVDQSPIAAGECTSLRWKVENVSEVYVYPQGEQWQDYPVAGEGSQEVCPEATTIYEMRVVQTDGNVVTQEVVVEVAGAEVENPLAGSSWQLAFFAGDQVPLPDTTITLAFDGADIAAGNAGCNDYNAVYTVSANQLTFGPATTTQKLCGEELDAQEAFYLFALEATSTYALDGNQLIFYDIDGAETLRFNRLG